MTPAQMQQPPPPPPPIAAVAAGRPPCSSCQAGSVPWCLWPSCWLQAAQGAPAGCCCWMRWMQHWMNTTSAGWQNCSANWPAAAAAGVRILHVGIKQSSSRTRDTWVPAAAAAARVALQQEALAAKSCASATMQPSKPPATPCCQSAAALGARPWQPPQWQGPLHPWRVLVHLQGRRQAAELQGAPLGVPLQELFCKGGLPPARLVQGTSVSRLQSSVM
jgi:hypothetical protein